MTNYINGFDREGRDPEGYNRNGRDREGYDRNGRNSNGRDREGYNLRDRDGRDRSGIERDDQQLKYGLGELSLAGAFLLFEDTIASDARLSYLYARDVKIGRFEKGEPVLLACPEWGPLYKALLKNV